MSPMLTRINQASTKDTLLCIACGVVFTVLTLSFII